MSFKGRVKSLLLLLTLAIPARAEEPMIKKKLVQLEEELGVEEPRGDLPPIQKALWLGNLWAASQTRDGEEDREYCGVVCEQIVGEQSGSLFLYGLNRGMTKSEIQSELNESVRGPRSPKNRARRTTKGGACSFSGLLCPKGSRTVSFFHSHPKNAAFSPADREFILSMRKKYPNLDLRLGLGLWKKDSNPQSLVFPPFDSGELRQPESRDGETGAH